MTVSGVDSAYAPTLAQAQAIRVQNHVFHGAYISGWDALNIWTPAEVAVLRAAGLAPLPICVPAQNGSEDPTAVAQAIIAACKAAGILCGGVVLDREHGSTFSTAWVGTWAAVVEAAGYTPVDYCGPHNPLMAHWWNPAFGTPPAGCAYQTGSSTIAGLSVDLDVADDAFPLGQWTPPDPPAPEKPVIPSPLSIAPIPGDVIVDCKSYFEPGVLVLWRSGAIYAFLGAKLGSDGQGHACPFGAPYFAGRQAACFSNLAPTSYTVEDTAGETYTYDVA